MLNSSDTLTIEVSYAELFEVVSSLLHTAKRYIDMDLPESLAECTLSRAEKFNSFLDATGCNNPNKEAINQLRAENKNNNH